MKINSDTFGYDLGWFLYLVFAGALAFIFVL